MKNKRKMNRPVKIMIIGLSVLIGVSAVACAGFVAGVNYKAGNSEVTEDGNGVDAGVIEHGVSVKMAYISPTAEDPYGSYKLSYTVTPTIYTDEIKAKLTYSDGTDVGSDALTLEHDTKARTVTIHCKGAFTKQVTLTLYAESDSSVNATMTFDFREKISVDIPDSIELKEGKVPSITPTVNTTGGTMSVDKEVKDVTYRWNAGFISWVKDQAQKEYDEYEADNLVNKNFDEMAIGDLVGLSDNDCADFFKTAFSANDFLTKKGCTYSYLESWTDDDSDDPWTRYTDTFYLGAASKETFLNEFNGLTPIIDWSCTVNGKTYTKSFGLNISAINVTGITVGIGNWVF